MEFSAAQIANIVGGSIEGNPDETVSSFGKIEDAVKGQLAFLANPKYEEYLYSTSANIIIINNSQIVKEEITATLITKTTATCRNTGTGLHPCNCKKRRSNLYWCICLPGRKRSDR